MYGGFALLAHSLLSLPVIGRDVSTRRGVRYSTKFYTGGSASKSHPLTPFLSFFDRKVLLYHTSY